MVSAVVNNWSLYCRLGFRSPMDIPIATRSIPVTTVQSLLVKTAYVAVLSCEVDCCDNAPVESFFGSLKQERFYFRDT